MLGFSSVGSNSTFSKWVLTNWFLLMKSFPLQPKQGLQFFFFWDDPAGCRSVSRRRWASAIGWRRDICCQGHGLLQRGGVRRRQEPVEMPAAPSGFHILLWIFNLLGKKINQPLGIEVIAATQVLSLFHSLFQDSQESGPRLLHPGSTRTSSKLEAEATGAIRQTHGCRLQSSWFRCVRYKPSEDLYCFIFLTSHKNTGFPGGSVGKNPPANARRLRRHGFDPWVGKSP